MKIQSIHIDKYKVFEDFDIDFRNDKGEIQNLIVIAGINGSGKTTLLKEIIKGDTIQPPAEYGADYYSHKFGNIIINNNGVEDTRQLPAIPEILASIINKKAYTSDVIYFATGKGTSAIDNVQNQIIRFVDSLIYTKNYRSLDAYNEVKKKINELFKEFNLQVEFANLNESKFVFFSNLQGEEFPIYSLSGGEQQLISKLFTLYIGRYKNQVILIDEPEESLHPSWQYRIAPLYKKIADENNCQIILATHSPQIISSIPKDSLRLLIKEDEKVKAISDFEGAYGWTVEKVLLEIQGVGNRVPEIENRLEKLSQMIHADLYDTPIFQKEFEDIENLLGSSDVNILLKKLEIGRRKKR